MKSKIPFIIFTGPSGVGKSTMIKACLNHSWSSGAKVVVPRKYTTRQLRGKDELREIRHLSREEFSQKKARGEFLYSFERYDELYALESETFSNPQLDTVYVQSLPSDVALKIKKLLISPWEVSVLRLRADAQVIRKRLIARGDSLSLRQMVDRAKGSTVPGNSQVDALLNASHSSSQMLQELEQLLAC